MKFLFFFVLLVFTKSSLIEAEPCSNIFKYYIDRGENIGVVTLRNPDRYKNVINVELSLRVKVYPGYFGTLGLYKNIDQTLKDVANGKPISFKIRFPVQEPFPKATAIYNNNRLLCTGPKEIAPFVTTIHHDYTLTSYSPSTQMQTYYTDRSGFSQTCGITSSSLAEFTGLIVRGKVGVRGQFPWLAAYHHLGEGEKGFICGGSLVSTRIVITAAHCIQGKSEGARNAEDALIFIGKYNIESLAKSERDYAVSGVHKFVIHPDWNVFNERYDADIAVAILTKKITFNKFVQPICLWPFSSSYEDLIGNTGVVAGWGKTEQSNIPDAKLKWTEIFVVSFQNCIVSNRKLGAILSDRSFCAGDIVGGSGPCNGDSGGGLITKHNNKWYLRGVISVALVDPILQMCDNRNYAVFTDVAKFNGWIQGFIQNYG